MPSEDSAVAGGGNLDTDAVKDLRAATDLAQMATERTAQAFGGSMSFMVVLHRHLWLTMVDLKEHIVNPFSTPLSLLLTSLAMLWIRW